MGKNVIIHNSKPYYTPMKEKYNAIHSLQPPNPVKQCKQFLGIVNYNSSFIWHIKGK